MEPIKAYQCTACGRAFSPARQVCLGCGGRQLEEVALERQGRLLTFTRLHALPMDFQTRTLMLGMVEFPGGLRALGQLETEQPRIGMKMEARWEVVRELGGEKIYGLRFYPAKG